MTQNNSNNPNINNQDIDLNNINLLPEPIRPEDWECCNSECGDSCIQEMYRRDKRAYDEQQKLLKQLQSNHSN